MPGAVEAELGELRLIPGPKGDTGERGPRGYGIESAVLNPDYTLTLKFEDGSSYTTSEIRGADGVGVESLTVTPGDYTVSPMDTLTAKLTDGKLFEFKLYNAAAGSALEASESARIAKSEREAAQQARDVAESAEAGALESERAASGSAARAAESALDARASRDAAELAKAGAAGSAERAEAAEGAAESCRDEAAESAGNAEKSARQAEQYSGKPPVIKNGVWWIWDADAGEYRDTGEQARGNLMVPGFSLDTATGDLYMIAHEEYAGPEFRLRGNDLEVVING